MGPWGDRAEFPASDAWAILLVNANPDTARTTVRFRQKTSTANVFTDTNLTKPFKTAGFATTMWNGLNGIGWVGVLGEAQLYNYPLSSADETTVWSNLSTKWGF